MKHKLKFLIGGFSLIALVLCHANPAEAQETEFTVTIFSIAFTVTPTGISLGNVAAAGTAQSDSTQCTGDGTTGFNCTGDISTRPITIKNNGTAAIGVFSQGTNANQQAPNFEARTWVLLETGTGTGATPSAEEFRWGFSLTTPQATPPTTTFLPGPGLQAGAGEKGEPKLIPMQVDPNETELVNWIFEAPLATQFLGQNRFTISFTGIAAPTL